MKEFVGADGIMEIKDGVIDNVAEAQGADGVQAEPKYYTVQRAAEILGVDKRTVYRWNEIGKLQFSQSESGVMRVSEEDILRLQKSRGTVKNNIVLYAYRSNEALAEADVKKMLATLGIRRSDCEIFKDTASDGRCNREKLFDFLKTKPVSQLWLTDVESLGYSYELPMIKRYLEAVGCELKILGVSSFSGLV